MPRVVAELGQGALERDATGLADDVADHEHPERARRRALGHRGQEVGSERPPAARAGPRDAAHFAYSTARVSRMTVTLICPG